MRKYEIDYKIWHISSYLMWLEEYLKELRVSKFQSLLKDSLVWGFSTQSRTTIHFLRIKLVGFPDKERNGTTTYQLMKQLYGVWPKKERHHSMGDLCMVWTTTCFLSESTWISKVSNIVDPLFPSMSNSRNIGKKSRSLSIWI